jgi:predicted cobalt transporter CbtA
MEKGGGDADPATSPQPEVYDFSLFITIERWHMRELTLGRVLLYAVIAGLTAGLLVTLFHAVITEPVIDRAIALEAQAAHFAAQPVTHYEAPVVSRAFQKSGGLLIGYVLYGTTWALIFTLVFFPLQSRLARFGPWRGALLLAALAWWAIILVPFIKYPANPPGVGDPETIDYRQNIYLALLLLSASGATLVVWLGGRLARQVRQPSWLIRGAGLLVVGAALVLLMPPNPDPITAPADLVFNFRVRSLLGLTLFWAMFGTVFGWLARRNARRATSPSAVAAS